MTRTITVSAGVLVDESGAALVVRKRGTAVFQQPGGKPEPGETALDALLREVEEEVGVRLDPARVDFLGTFEAVAANEPDHRVIGTAFRAVVTRSDVQIGAEIEEARWLLPDDVEETPLANLSREHLIAHAWMAPASVPVIPLPRTVLADAADRDVVLSARTTLAAPGAVSETLRALFAVSGLPVPRPAGDGEDADIDLSILPGGPAESYRITVTADAVRVVAADEAGLAAAVYTLHQLVRRGTDEVVIPAVHLADHPRFAYRGVMLDVARHFFDAATVSAYIDRAAALKFTHLHLHLTDDQGWRLESPSRPALTERGAGTAVGGGSGGFFTAADYRDIVAYAAHRHMTVVPEIDVPGHTHAVSLAYPDLNEPPALSPAVEETVAAFGGGMPENGVPYTGMAVGFSSLRIDDDATDLFLQDVFTDLAALTPGPYLHIGGDEALGTPPAAYARFVTRVTAIVAGLGKIPITWHEAGGVETLHPGTVGQYWSFVSPVEGADDRTRAFVERGGRVILSPADAVYLDMKPEEDFPLGLTWARGVTTVRRAYEWDPAEVVDGITEDDILGIEAPLWTETVTSLGDIDALAYPRIAAAAEAAWSAPLGTTPDRSWDGFRGRVRALLPLWSAAGIRVPDLAEIDDPAEIDDGDASDQEPAR